MILLQNSFDCCVHVPECLHAEPMIRSSPVRNYKRQKTQLSWRRFIDDDAEYSTIRVHEKPNMKILAAIKNMSSDLLLEDMDEEKMRNTLGELDRLYTSISNGGGKRVAEYQQNDMRDAIQQMERYGGSRRIGRAYTSSNLQRLRSKVLNTLYKTTHVELDIVSCFTTMLWNAFGDDTMGWMKGYCQTPDVVYDDFLENFSIKKEDVKLAVCSLIGAHPRKPVTYGLDEGETDKIDAFRAHPFIRGFYLDLQSAAIKMRSEYPEFMEMMRIYSEMRGKGDMHEGVAFTIMCGDMEHAVMRTVISHLQSNSPLDNFVWKFDGIVIDKAHLPGDKDQFISDMRRLVKEKHGLDVQFKIKQLEDKSYPICLPDSDMLEDSSEYGRWKQEFEVSYFRLDYPSCFCQIAPDGSLWDLNMIQFRHNTSEHPQEFVKQWINDKFKRKYISKDFSPPPLAPVPGSFNTWSGLGVDKINVDVPEDYDIGPYMKHVKLLMGDNEEYADYFHKLIAIKIQKPGFLWRVMPFIRSTPGVGKDIFFTFITKIFGSVNCLRVGRVSEVMDKGSHLLDSKLLICFSETEFQDNCRVHEQLKNIITSEELLVKKKYVNEYTIRSVACFMAFSNNFGAFQIPADDRRFFAVTADGTFANDPRYHVPLIEYLSKPETVKAVARWYKEVDLSSFDPSGDRPMTETFMEMAASSLSVFDIMLRKNFAIWVSNGRASQMYGYQVINDVILQIPSSVIWDDFLQTCMEMKIPNMESKSKAIQFGTRLLSEANARMQRFKTKELESMKNVIVDYKFGRDRKRMKKIDIAGMQKYITEMLGENDMDEGEDDGMADGFVPGR